MSLLKMPLEEKYLKYLVNTQFQQDLELLKQTEKTQKLIKEFLNYHQINQFGPGELAIYWLYQHQKTPVTTSDTRGGDDPDLRIGDKKVEVKAYGKHTGKIKLGKFASQKANIRLLSIVFGFHSLYKILNLESSKKAVTPTNFRPVELQIAFQDIFKVKDSGILSQEAEKFEIIRNIKEKLELLDSELQNPGDPSDAAKAVLSRLVMSKFKTKPGDEGYIASAIIEGEVHFFYIDFDKLRQANLLELVEIKGSEIAVDFKSIFGQLWHRT